MQIIDGLIRDIPDEQQAKNVAYKIFSIIIITTFIVEALIMLLVMELSGIYSLSIIFTDSFLLTVTISPLIYFLFLKPLLINISKRALNQKDMIHINEKLNRESQRLFKVLDGLPAAVHLLDRDHKIKFANRYFRENFGDIREQPCYSLMHNRDEACEICKTFEVFGKSQMHEREVLRKNGKIYNVYNYPFVDTDGQELVLQLGIDITKRKKAENDLLQRERQLNMVLNSMSDTLYTIDKDECITAIYGEGLREAGIHTNNLIGRRISDLFEPQRLSEFRKAFQKVLNGQNTLYSWETQLPTGNLHFQNALSPVFDERGKVIHITGIARNLTPQKMLERKMIEAEKLLTVARMSAMISHEFRNSLTSVRMILELLEEAEDIKAGNKKSLEVALNSVNGMENTVDQLLVFARPSQVTFGRCDIIKVIEESINLVTAQLKKLNISLIKTQDIDSLIMEIDCIKIKESFVNILINAIQAISDNTNASSKREIMITSRQITLQQPLWNKALYESVDKHAQPETVWQEKFDITLPSGSDVLHLSFSDTGPGIKREHLSQIFDSFFTTRKDGSGLGLAVVKRNIAEHNGVITITSMENNGTNVSVYLKIHKSNEK